MHSMFSDSDRQPTEELLRLYDRAMAATSTGIVISDAQQPELPIIYCNPAFEKITGYSPEDVIGRNCRFLQGSDTDPKAIARIRAALHTAQECQVTLKNYRKNGTPFWNELTISPIFNSQRQLTHFVGVQSDITERYRAEAALRQSESQYRQQTQRLQQALQELKQTQTQLVQSEKMSSLGQLVAGVAHEINNPVNFIYGNLVHASRYTQDLLDFLQLYQQYYPDTVPEIQEQAESIDLDFVIADLPKLLSSMKMGTDRICQIVQSLRNFSRIDEAEMKFVDIHDGLESTLLILQNRLKSRVGQSTIVVEKHYGDLPLVECYVGQLNQVFMNILTNAIDALEEAVASQTLAVQDNQTSPNQASQPTISITTEVQDQAWAVIRIADNGPRIPPEIQSRLFDPFFTTKPIGQGTGLGLSISHQIVVDKHGGQLQCVSLVGVGTEFIIQIPLRQQPPTAELKTTPAAVSVFADT